MDEQTRFLVITLRDKLQNALASKDWLKVAEVIAHLLALLRPGPEEEEETVFDPD